MKIESPDEYSDDYEMAAKQVRQTTRLSPREAKQYILRRAGFSTREIAERMGVSENTVQSRRGKIREKIREAKNTAGLDL